MFYLDYYSFENDLFFKGQMELAIKSFVERSICLLMARFILNYQNLTKDK